MLNRSRVSRSVLVGLAIYCSFAVHAAAQNPAPTPVSSAAAVKLAAEAKKIKEKIVKIGVGNDVTIVRRDGTSFHGSIAKIDADTFVIADVDRKTDLEFNYQQIKQVDKGYSKANPITGQRVPPKTRKIITWTALAVLGVAIVIIVKGLNDPNF